MATTGQVSGGPRGDLVPRRRVTATVAVASCTSPGRVRATNQDWFGYFEAPDNVGVQGRLFVLADGMGGEAGGEVASRLAVDVMAKAYFERPSEPPAAALERSVLTANEAIQARAAATADLRGMGTTCTALVLSGNQGWIAHVGDSRAYRIRGGRVARLTADHSLAHRGPSYAHVLTRAVGVQPTVEVDVMPLPDAVRRGDVFLLCSDGLWGQVGDADIAAIIGEHPDLQVASQRMVDMANARGGPDNISVLLARVEALEHASWAKTVTGPLHRAWNRWLRRDVRSA